VEFYYLIEAEHQVIVSTKETHLLLEQIILLKLECVFWLSLMSVTAIYVLIVSDIAGNSCSNRTCWLPAYCEGANSLIARMSDCQMFLLSGSLAIFAPLV